MEHRLKQRRSSGSGNDKAWSWLRRASFQGEYTQDDEHLAAVAAAAFSIHSLEEAGLLNLHKMTESSPKISRTKRMSCGGETSVKGSFGQDPRTTESAFPVRRPSGISSPRPVPSPSRCQKQIGNSAQDNNDKAKAEAWEKAKIERTQKRYEKIRSQILSWESERKNQVKLHMERKKKELEHRRAMATQHYNNEIARIGMIAQRATAQLEEKRRKEVSHAREKCGVQPKNLKQPREIFQRVNSEITVHA